VRATTVKTRKPSKPSTPSTARVLAHTGCDAVEMTRKNLLNALRALDLMSGNCAGLCPSPAVIVAAEINNAMRHVKLLTGVTA
jgi:hypothetical protein